MSLTTHICCLTTALIGLTNRQGKEYMMEFIVVVSKHTSQYKVGPNSVLLILRCPN